MGKILFFLLFIFVPSIAFGQIWIEHFNYSDTLPDPGGVWNRHSGSDTIPVLSGSLTYPGYMASEGNRVELSKSRDADVSRDLDQSYNSGVIYASFLMKVTGIPSDTGYFFHFMRNRTTFAGSVWISETSDPTKFRLGIHKRSAQNANQVTWYNQDLYRDSTYLVVVKYQFVSGSNNDTASLWVFGPGSETNIPATEPTPHAKSYIVSSGDIGSIDSVALRQVSGIGTVEIDEIRVGTSWGDAPVPVQVSNVIAEVFNRYIRIEIQTWTEDAEFLGFNVYRSRDGKEFGMIASYENDESLRAKGTGGFGSRYEFVDKGVSASGEYYYKVEAVSLNERKFVGDVLRVFFNPPTRYFLSQNYPNPFNPETLIEFELPEEVRVVLVVYDVLGREVGRLVDGVMPAGYHKVKFDASNLASGVYFYRLQAGKFVDVKKMVLLK